jgi:hypothetical protein
MRDKINELQKGAVFLAELKRRLFLEGYTLAIPEPDYGDDLWVADVRPTVCSGNGTEKTESPELLRCQLKSSLPSKADSTKYTFNFTKNEQLCLREGYFVFLGLYDPDLRGAGFHIACIPGTFFRDLVNQDKLRPNKAGRRVFDVFFSKDDSAFSLRLKPSKRYAREPRLPLTNFFVTHQSLRAAFANSNSTPVSADLFGRTAAAELT